MVSRIAVTISLYVAIATTVDLIARIVADIALGTVASISAGTASHTAADVAAYSLRVAVSLESSSNRRPQLAHFDSTP